MSGDDAYSTHRPARRHHHHGAWRPTLVMCLWISALASAGWIILMCIAA